MEKVELMHKPPLIFMVFVLCNSLEHEKCMRTRKENLFFDIGSELVIKRHVFDSALFLTGKYF